MKKLNYYFSLVLIVFVCANGAAQEMIIEDEDRPQAEFDVAINPLNPENIIVATMHGFSDIEDSYLSVYFTLDGGTSWSKSHMDGNFGIYDAAGDPVIEFDHLGKAYIVNLVVDIETFTTSTVLSSSEDGGASWTIAATFAEDTDKPWLDIDRSDVSPYLGNIYIPVVTFDGMQLLVYNQVHELISSVNIPKGDQLPSVAVQNDGDVYVSTVGLNNPNVVFLHRFTEGGTELIADYELASFPDFTFNAPEVSGRFQPTVYLRCDNSDGPFSDRLYLTYTASESSNPMIFDVFIIWSDDDGESWTEPKLVHEDNSVGYQQFYSSSYVSPKGTLIVDWYDRAGQDPSSGLTDFKLGVSTDGGDTFSEVKLNSVPMDFLPLLAENNGFGIGEYHQCVANETQAYSFWSDGRTNDGDLNIYYAIVDIEEPSLSVHESGIVNSGLSVTNVYPLPADERIFVDFTLAIARDLQIEIMGLDGKIVFKLPGQKFSTGAHTIEVPVEVPSGSYMLSFRSRENILVSKNIVVK